MRWSAVRRGLVALLGCGLLVTEVSSQVQIRVNQVRPPGLSGSTAADESGLAPPQDRDAESWLKRARDAAEREDWKLASDTLSRVIREHGRKIVTLDEGKTFHSAGVCAQQQIGGWPAAGREAYRVLFDGEAQRLLDKAQAEHDTLPLWAIVREFPHTTHGPRAIELLTAWLLDLGRPGEASDALDRLSLYSDERLPKWRELELRAMVQSALRLPAAVETLSELKKMTGVAKGLPPDWAARLDAIENYRVETLAADSTFASIATGPWSTPLGPAGAHGHAPAVTPVVTPQMPWSDRLPGVDRVDEALALRIIDATARVPVWRAVTDGRLLFYTGQSGLVARDLSTFDLVWQSVPLTLGSEARISGVRNQLGFFNDNRNVVELNRGRLDQHTTRALFHEYAGLTTCAHGLVFQIEQPVYEGELRPTRDGDSESFPLSEDPVMPNSIRAFKADSGLTAWTLGRSGPVQDELRDAHFYSTPIAAGPNLIAPYERGHDFFLAVIRPDGTIEQKIHLGTGHTLMFPINSVLTPVAADGTIYVPTGAGMLAALSESDFSLRWLTRYDRVENRGRRSGRQQRRFMMGQPVTIPQADEWIASPPILVGQTVLLAPQDSDKLIAIDRSTGSIKWKARRRRHRYIVGADETRVIIAGKEIEAIRIADGESEWEFNPDSGVPASVIPTGRPILAGAQVLVPTDSGLLTLNSATGQPAAAKLAYGEPLGNLLVAEGALYSLSATTIVKFPDVVWTRSRAQERLASNPADLDAAIRLAWLAALENKWQDVLTLLDAASAGSGDAARDEGLLDRAAHLRVTALLRLAEDMDTAPARSALEKAASAARQPADVVDVGLALMDRTTEGGDAVGAFSQGVALLARAGNEAVHIEAGLNGRASILIGDRLRRIAGGLVTAELRDQATRLVRESVAKAALPSVKPLLADALGFHEEAVRLDIESGRAAQSAGNVETAVYYYSRAARRAASMTPPSDGMGAEALIRCAVLLADPGRDLPASPAAALAVLSEVSKFPSVMALPADLEVGAKDSAAFVEKLRTTLAATAGAVAFKPTPKLRMVKPNTEGAWFPERSFDFRDAAGDVPIDVLPVRQNRAIMGIALRDSDRVWAGGVAWNSVAAPVSDVQDFYNSGEPQQTPSGKSRSAARSQQVAILDTGPTFQAVGLSTGRCMWRPLAIDRSRGDLPKPSVAAVDGVAIVAPDAGTLVALPARDGAEPLWTRDFGRIRLGQLSSVGNSLVAIDREASRVFVIEPQSGRIARQYAISTLEPPPEATGAADGPAAVNTLVALSGSVICRGEGKRVVARDVQSGRPVWDKVMAARVRGLQVVDSSHIAINYRGDRLAVVCSDTGDVVKDLTIDDLELPAMEIVLEGRTAQTPGRLLLFARTDDDPPKYKLASYPMDGGEPSFQGPWDNAMVTRRMMTGSPDYVAVIRYDRRGSDPQDRNVQIQVIGGQPQIVDGPSGARGASLVIYDKNQGLRRVARHEFSASDNAVGRAIYGSRAAEVSDVIFAGPNVIAFGPYGNCVLGPAKADENKNGSKSNSGSGQP